MDAPAAVLAVVLLETAVGGLVIVWAVPTWGAVRHGYEILQTGLLGLLALGAWGAIRAPLAAVEASSASGAPSLAEDAMLATAVLALGSALLLIARSHAVARVAGIVSAVVGLAAFVPVAQVRALVTDGSLLPGVVELLLGAFFLGGVWVGLILGHWYLVERRLSNRYMVQVAWVNVAAAAAGLGAILMSARNPLPCAGLTGDELIRCSFSYSPILSIGSFTIYMGIGLLLLVALIAGFNVKLAREGGRSIQASTGMFYLAVILAPAAEFAAKIRYF